MSPFFNPRKRNYGPLPWDLRHVLSLRYTWILPKPGKHLRWRIVRMTMDGWELSGITRLSTGAPFTPTFSTVDGQDITGTPSEAARVDLVRPEAEVTKRFTRPARGSFGNTGPGILRGDGINNFDMSVARQFRRKERYITQIRIESYNTLNHTQFLLRQAAARFDLQGQQVDPVSCNESWRGPHGGYNLRSGSTGNRDTCGSSAMARAVCRSVQLVTTRPSATSPSHAPSLRPGCS